jgi:Transglutaminase-like superfamily
MKRQIVAFFRLSLCERALLVNAWVSLLVADLAVRVLPLSGVRRLLAPRRSQQLPLEPIAVVRLARLIEIAASHHLIPMRCLQRSLVLERWLRQRGLAASLQIGVRREGFLLQAHAWVEHNGQPVAERTGNFSPLLGAR